MKKIKSIVVSALVLSSVIWFSSVNAADDFDALLNSLTEDSQTEQTTDTNDTTGDTTTNETTTDGEAEASTEGEVDLESLATEDTTSDNTTSENDFNLDTKTYSDEVELEPEEDNSANQNLEYEPEETSIVVESNTGNNYANTANNNISQKQLTPTGIDDMAILFLAMMLSLGIYSVRRKKS